MQFGKRKVNFAVVMMVITVLISLIVVYFQSNKELDVYTGKGTTESEIEKTTDVELTTYQSEVRNYTIGIPDGWTKVTKDGYETFVHSPSASSVQIQITDYSPYILLVNGNTIQEDLSDNGCVLNNFGWYDSTSYSTIYTKNTSSGNTTYIEATHFDKKTIIRLVFILKTENVERLNDAIVAIVDSFKWEKEDPFPEGFGLYYSEYGNYEFAYPLDWEIGTSDNVYLVQNNETNSAISIMANKSTVSYASTSKLDYTNYAAASRSNFSLKNYNASDDMIYAQATFTANDVPMVLTQYLIASGEYEYAITFETPQEIYSNQAEMFESVIDTFRIF